MVSDAPNRQIFTAPGWSTFELRTRSGIWPPPTISPFSSMEDPAMQALLVNTSTKLSRIPEKSSPKSPYTDEPYIESDSGCENTSNSLYSNSSSIFSSAYYSSCYQTFPTVCLSCRENILGANIACELCDITGRISHNPQALDNSETVVNRPISTRRSLLRSFGRKLFSSFKNHPSNAHRNHSPSHQPSIIDQTPELKFWTSTTAISPPLLPSIYTNARTSSAIHAPPNRNPFANQQGSLVRGR